MSEVKEDKKAKAAVSKTEIAEPTVNEKLTVDATAEKTSVVKEPLIYMGPNLPGGALLHGHTFKCGLDELVHFKGYFDKVPELKKLFIQVTKIVKFKADLQIVGTSAHTNYKNAKEKIVKGALNG